MKNKKRIKKRSLKHRIFLHPLWVLLVLLVGILLLASTAEVLSSSVTIFAKVSAPLLSSPATIQIVTPVGAAGGASDIDNHSWSTQSATSARNALHIDEKTITLTGSCPKDSHIEIYRNGIFAGAASCIGDPTFSIQIDLSPGMNKITALVYNSTDDQGPTSLAIYVSYDVPKSATSTGTSSSSTPAKTAPNFLLTSNFTSLGFLANQTASWDILIAGGTKPYRFRVDWGDGQASNYTLDPPGILTIKHDYKKASSLQGYTIVVKGIDAAGQTSELQLLTIISQPNTAQAAQITQANKQLNPSILAQIGKWLWVEWPAYLVIVLMLFSFWLGEREEYKILVNKFRRRRA